MNSSATIVTKKVVKSAPRRKEWSTAALTTRQQ